VNSVPPLAWQAARDVPAAIDTVAGWPAARRVQEADACTDVIASGADVLKGRRLRRGSGPRRRRHRPGGSRFAGMHWHADGARCLACPGPGTLPLYHFPDPGPSVGAVFTPRPLADQVAAHLWHTQPGPAVEIDGTQADISRHIPSDLQQATGPWPGLVMPARAQKRKQRRRRAQALPGAPAPGSGPGLPRAPATGGAR
jgi:hypothetical protein